MKRFIRQVKKCFMLLALTMAMAIPANAVYGQPENWERRYLEITNFETVPYSLRYELTRVVRIGLSINNRVASMYADCDAYEAVDISITLKLQRQENGSWRTIATYRADDFSDYCSVEEERAVTGGYDYRLQAVYILDDGVSTETITKTSSIKYCD